MATGIRKESDLNSLESFDFSPESSYLYFAENMNGSQKIKRHLIDNFNGNVTKLADGGGQVRRSRNGCIYVTKAGSKNQYIITSPDEATPTVTLTQTMTDANFSYDRPMMNQPVSIYTKEENLFTREAGEKHYELTDWLGNVRVVITNRKHLSTTTTPPHFEPQVVGVRDYYPFGMQIRARSYETFNYKYGFGTQEKDDEITGIKGTHYTAMFWEYDTRLGRRWNVDPKVDAWESVYAAFANNPIYHRDILGDTEEERKKALKRAKEWKNKSKNTSASYGGKGTNPGQAVDCSGLVSNCITEAGRSNPNKGNSNGVTNIVKNSTKVDFDDIEEGYIVTFNNNGHIGIISGNIERDENGKVTSFSVIGSQSSTGPAEFTVFTDMSTSWSKKTNDNKRTNNAYWSPKLGSAYKWDTPDEQKETRNKRQTIKESQTLFNPFTNQTLIIPKQEQLYIIETRPLTLAKMLQQSRVPIFKTIGFITGGLGY